MLARPSTQGNGNTTRNGRRKGLAPHAISIREDTGNEVGYSNGWTLVPSATEGGETSGQLQMCVRDSTT